MNNPITSIATQLTQQQARLQAAFSRVQEWIVQPTGRDAASLARLSARLLARNMQVISRQSDLAWSSESQQPLRP